MDGRPAIPRTLLSRDRGEVTAVLATHLGDEALAIALLDEAGLHGDAQVTRAKVQADGDGWMVDLFAPRRDVEAGDAA